MEEASFEILSENGSKQKRGQNPLRGGTAQLRKIQRVKDTDVSTAGIWQNVPGQAQPVWIRYQVRDLQGQRDAVDAAYSSTAFATPAEGVHRSPRWSCSSSSSSDINNAGADQSYNEDKHQEKDEDADKHSRASS